MIRFSLTCTQDHRFEGWFRSNEDYEAQAADGLLSCPLCDSSEIRKAPMAPAVSTSERQENLRKLVDQMRKQVEANADNVGEEFPAEARRMHYGETEARAIYGEASLTEARELVDEGIPVAPLPWRTDRNH